VRGLDAPLCKLDDDAADFLDRPADQERCLGRRRRVPIVKVPRSKVKLPQRSNKGRYDDQASLKRVNFVGERF
jgi:hypothetical protein